ncbi:beta-microseminoprotein isoform X1 [Hippopotamus amphibius kiboko]|uniref:beta-microseminoprotein isoform X1 n=1 Tax=Hippopotamus amphibius kiboko TaxID=575201 RepID=UPI00259646B5|nr:beta-microseminoprotein isoform X1 [Hippopotamus amphibius kiboko]
MSLACYLFKCRQTCSCHLCYKFSVTFPGCTCLQGLVLIRMNALLGSLVVLATFVTLCDAQCYVILNQNPASNECKDLSGVTHPRNSKWNTENCEECTCDEGVTNCCNTAAIPMGYDTDKCQKIFNKETCTYKVVEKEDPEKTCDVSGWVV